MLLDIPLRWYKKLTYTKELWYRTWSWKIPFSIGKGWKGTVTEQPSMCWIAQFIYNKPKTGDDGSESTRISSCYSPYQLPLSICPTGNHGLEIASDGLLKRGPETQKTQWRIWSNVIALFLGGFNNVCFCCCFFCWKVPGKFSKRVV